MLELLSNILIENFLACFATQWRWRSCRLALFFLLIIVTFAVWIDSGCNGVTNDACEIDVFNIDASPAV